MKISELTPQHMAVCRFEAPFNTLESCRPAMKEGQVRQLTKQICCALGLVMPLVQFLDPATDWTLENSNCCAYCCPVTNRLVFGPNGRDRWTVIHEIAHHVTNSYGSPRMDAHGSEFVGALIVLAARYWTIPSGALDYVYTYPPGWEQLHGYVNDWSYKGTEFAPRKHVPQHDLWQMAKECGVQADVNVKHWLKARLVGRWKEAA